MAENGMIVSVKDGILTVKMPVAKKPAPSKSGKTLVVASSHGNVKTEAVVNGKPVYIGLNAYVKED